ncbi:hypothetical protein A0O21_06950 [Streptococcus pantholopis]|uniref:GrpB family protein n=1 Tax=Streptococcus pantholopis TaxID=1811193 RepID=A0A172Q8M3_9STRE|nr:hypothetical protein A0O21_06950 [Streptococcus pantholopis]
MPTDFFVRINHIGSTSVPNIWAKNIVDILLEVKDYCAMERVKGLLLDHGWRCMNETKKRASFNKGYTDAGFADRVFHLHLRLYGDCDELYFCDYLRRHPEIARDYERLKLSLWKKFEHNRDGYTEAKTDFIKKYTKLGKSEFTGTDRYPKS